MSEQVKYEPKGLSHGGNGEGSDTDWVPLPPNRYRMQVESMTIKESTGTPRRGQNGKEQKQYPRVLFRVQLIEAEADALKKKVAPRLKEGQEQSITAWASFNYTWGWLDDKNNQFHATKLFDFATDCGGFLVKSDAKKWLMAEGTLDPQWFVGMEFRGIVEHSAKEGGGVWVNVTPQSLDDCEQPNRERFIGALRLNNPKLLEWLIEHADEAAAGEGGEKPLF